MIRVRRDPIWMLPVVALFLAWWWFTRADDRSTINFFIIALGVTLALRLGFWVLTRTNKPPVPDSAVKKLLDYCSKAGDNEEWILVEFPPGVSLEEARQRVGSISYSKQNRLQGFMTKMQFMEPSRPDVAVFYSPQKGFLMGNAKHIKALEEKYGRWMLDTWYSLTGALRRKHMDAWNLDGGQIFTVGQHLGSEHTVE